MKLETKPDFQELEKVIRGEKQPTRVHLVELGIDGEVARFLAESVLERKWVPDTEETRTQYMRQHVELYAALGYDFAGAWAGFGRRHRPALPRRTALG